MGASRTILSLSLTIALLATACSGDDTGTPFTGATTQTGGDTTTAPSTTAGSGEIPFGIAAPTGWAVAADGLAIAESEADLTADEPSGPRILISHGLEEDPLAVLAAEGDIEVVEDPFTAAVLGGVDATVIVLSEVGASGGVTIQEHIVLGGDEAALITLEAPADQWVSRSADLEEIVSLRRAEPPVTTTTTTTPPATTTTAPPETDPAALAYVELISTGAVADAEAAAEMSSGPARWYARYLSIGTRTQTHVVDRGGGNIDQCFDDGTCIELSAFEVEDGVVNHFVHNGVALRRRVWRPASLDGTLCIGPGGALPCDDPPADGSLVMTTLAAFIETDGDLIAAFELTTGEDAVVALKSINDAFDSVGTAADGTKLTVTAVRMLGQTSETVDGGVQVAPAGVTGTVLVTVAGFSPIPDDTSFTLEVVVEWNDNEWALTFDYPDIP